MPSVESGVVSCNLCSFWLFIADQINSVYCGELSGMMFKYLTLTILNVRIMHAGCVGEMESGRGELSRDDDGDPVLLSSCEKFGDDDKL